MGICQFPGLVRHTYTHIHTHYIWLTPVDWYPVHRNMVNTFLELDVEISIYYGKFDKKYIQNRGTYIILNTIYPSEGNSNLNIKWKPKYPKLST